MKLKTYTKIELVYTTSSLYINIDKYNSHFKMYKNPTNSSLARLENVIQSYLSTVEINQNGVLYYLGRVR